MHDGARRLSQAEVVLGQGVLGVVAASGHALAALGAAGALGADTAEEGIGLLHTRAVTEVDAHRCHLEGVPDAHLVGNGLHDDITRRHRRVGDDAEHARCLVVVGRELTGPVGDVRPLLVLEEALRRDVEGVGVDEGSAADTGSGEHHDVLEDVDALDAGAAEGRSPQESAQAPRGLGEVGVREAPTGLEHSDAVALLRETQRGDRATEARAHDEDVVVEASHALPPSAENRPEIPAEPCLTGC